MPQATCHELIYQPDSTLLFEALRALPCPAFLDSAQPYCERGRFDILAADPLAQIFETENIHQTASYDGYLNRFTQLQSRLTACLEPLDPLPDIPFCGGAIGFFAYDLNHTLIGQGPQASAGPTLPLITLAVYGWAIVVDHRLQRSQLVVHPATPAERIEKLLAILRDAPSAATPRFRLTGEMTANLDRTGYAERFARVQDYIRAGDCYQINLARRFSAPCEGDPWQAYRKLRGIAAAPFSAFLELGQAAVLSFSPERFLSLQNRRVVTEPIKGTAPRAALPERDRELAQALLGSDKNRAENLMIVDLLRNDLGQCCLPGSIHVDKLFELQTFNTVHHLVSTVSGELRKELGALDLLGACFPGGSITGAPKRRAMEIIRELEPDPRSVYCGAIAWLSADGNMDSNIAIRTMVCQDNRLYCWSGGGIVADSVMEDEFEETWNKVGKLLEAL